MEKFHKFSKATGLIVNHQKCKAYYGEVDDQIKNDIQHITSYVEGKLPYEYLGISLTAKKLSTHHCLKLVEKLLVCPSCFGTSMAKPTHYGSDGSKTYYFKNHIIHIVPITDQCSWILRVILNLRNEVYIMQAWTSCQQNDKFNTRRIYKDLKGDRNKVIYRKLFYNNLARPMALFMMWLAFQERLAAKDKVLELDMINEDNCVFYNQLESQEHLLFYCYGMQSNWKLVTS
ncbi:hypothetical protein KIW84_011711 [Lathyrus oleraceus]|uniref:Reverse transcriptase zinc-binding domain-containing protein n=1 Tax=Pisum sativum TaxID=3888 RepID=A0A9D5GVK8_PEA|nr:hypothetical protein KIW84_011711 [Pisum sativum]